NELQNGNDVAVVILSQPATVTPLLMNTTALSTADVGMNVRLVGYGIDSGNDTQGTSAGTKRQVTTPPTRVDPRFTEVGTASKDTCEGDSGGPAFLTINGTEYIAGITSYGVQGCGGGSHDTRVDTVASEFVQPYINMYDPGYTPGGSPDLATPPSPPDMAMA